MTQYRLYYSNGKRTKLIDGRRIRDVFMSELERHDKLDPKKRLALGGYLTGEYVRFPANDNPQRDLCGDDRVINRLKEHKQQYKKLVNFYAEKEVATPFEETVRHDHGPVHTKPGSFIQRFLRRMFS